MTKSTKIIIGVIVVIIVIAGIWYGLNREPAGEEGPIKIGVIAPLTSNAADIGKSNKVSMEIAVKEINEKGGINGREIQLIIEDSVGCDSKTAVTAMQKLVNIDKVVAVYSICSGVALSTHSVAEQGKVVHFGCASNPEVRELGDYMFRIVPADDFAGKVAAKYIKDEFSANRVAVLNCDNDWCVGIKDAFIEAFESLDGEILIEEQIETGATDARTELSKIKDTNPDLVYFSSYAQEAITVFRQAKEIGLDVPFFGGDAWLDQSIPKEAGDTAENKFFTTPAGNYSEEFEAKVNGDIAICTVEAYDVIYILADAIEKAGTDSEAIKNELYNLRDYKGESGIIGLDEKGDLIGASFDIKTFKDGEIIDYELGIKAE